MQLDNPTILIVDDEIDIREPLCDYLELNEFNRFDAESSESAEKLLELHSTDLIVLDIMMPGESDLDLYRGQGAVSNSQNLEYSVNRVNGRYCPHCWSRTWS